MFVLPHSHVAYHISLRFLNDSLINLNILKTIL